MSFNATLFGQFLAVLDVVIIFFTMKFASGKTRDLFGVLIIAVITNLLLPPVGWFFCYYWAKRQPSVHTG